jgi:centromeric protein E
MVGTKDDPGILPLTMRDIFAKIPLQESSEFLVRVSYLELYNEEIKDLLDPRPDVKFKIVDDKKKGPFVPDLHEEVVTRCDEVEKLLERGERARSYGFTEMNATSSRSHVIFKMIIEARKVFASHESEAEVEARRGFRTEWESQHEKSVCVSSLYLVDLAGSERQKKTGASGDRLKEGKAINKSLLTLGTVISELSKGGKQHIPYRDSKLTRLLSASLGGNARTAMLSALCA